MTLSQRWESQRLRWGLMVSLNLVPELALEGQGRVGGPAQPDPEYMPPSWGPASQQTWVCRPHQDS